MDECTSKSHTVKKKLYSIVHIYFAEKKQKNLLL